MANEHFSSYGKVKDNIRTLTPSEAHKAIREGALYVDLRSLDFSDYKIPDVPDIFLLPLNMLSAEYKKLPGERLLILADSTGLHSREAVRFLQENGYANVSQMAGGFVEWERDGLPVREDINERLTGACACQLKPRDRLK